MPCPEQEIVFLRTEQGEPAGNLKIAVRAAGLSMQFLPAPDMPSGGHYLIRSLEGETRFPLDAAGTERAEALEVAWEELTEDACNQAFSISIERLPTETAVVQVSCPAAAPGTTLGGGGGRRCGD